MIQGFDCATPLTYDLARRFKTGGHELVCRYLVPSGWKAITATEAQTITAAGLQIISVFETTADRALGGYTAGVNDGYTAAKVAATVGQTEGSCIYFAVDFDATPDQLATVMEYIRGASEATPKHTTGIYGSYAVIKAAQAAGVCSRFWQTYAWSGGRRADGINLYQYKNDITVNGIGVDFNNAFGNEGSWQVKKEDEEYMMKPEDANKVIGYLKASYEIAPNMEAKEECRRLANELRKASGQPEE